MNVLRLALHPDGMAPRIGNLAQWRGHLLTQLRHRAQALGDQRLRELRDELLGYPGGMAEVTSPAGVVLPLRYRRAGGTNRSLLSARAAKQHPASRGTLRPQWLCSWAYPRSATPPGR